jgi:bifunctional DNA-binding transcriptional regulator/antitoxin component of YhaV-PrlF toxin-antitoxin module
MATLQLKLTSKRQATFPASTCHALGIQPGDTIEMESRVLEGETVWILKPRPALDFSWIGSLKGKGTKAPRDHSMEAVRQSIATGRKKDKS